MTEVAAPAPVAAPTAAPAAPTRTTVEDRAAALKASFASEGADVGTAEPAAETSTASGDEASPSASDSARPASADDAAAKARAERLARIEQVRAKERAQDEERQRKRAQKTDAGEAEKLRARLAELEPLESVFSSEEALLEMAERKGMSAEKLVQWMRARLTDPAAVAKQQAKSEADKLREEMAALKKQLDEEKRAAQAEIERTRVHAEAVQRAQTFVQQVQGAETHPRSAALLKKYGPQGLVAFANQFITPLLPESYELTDLHDHLEQFLDEVQIANGGGPPANGTSQPQAKKNGAEQPVTTLSNALASERTTAVEEIPLHRLSREERKRRLKEKLANE